MFKGSMYDTLENISNIKSSTTIETNSIILTNRDDCLIGIKINNLKGVE